MRMRTQQFSRTMPWQQGLTGPAWPVWLARSGRSAWSVWPARPVWPLWSARSIWLAVRRGAAALAPALTAFAVLAAFAVLSGMFSPSCAAAQRAPSSSDASAVNRAAAVPWLERIRVAAQQQNYKGVFVYQRGSFVQSSRIEHYVTRAEGRYERIESLDGKPRQMLRHNDDLYTFLPERHLCVVEKRQNEEPFPALFAAGLGDVLSVYTPKLAGTDRVAGVASQVIELVPKDGYRFAYRLWADAKTGLLLRAQTLGPDGQVLEQLAFSQINIGVPADAGPIASGIRSLGNAGGAGSSAGSAAGWTIVRPPIGPVDIEAQGWTLPLAVPGFRKIRELRRPMAASDAGAPPIPVDQAVFSDGLATVSVFIEPVAHNSRKAGIGSSGATHALVVRRGNYWLTLLGEVPEATLQRFAAAITWKAPK